MFNKPYYQLNKEEKNDLLTETFKDMQKVASSQSSHLKNCKELSGEFYWSQLNCLVIIEHINTLQQQNMMLAAMVQGKSNETK